MEKLQKSKIAIFGVGGVGGYCTDALARCGIGSFVLVDNDKISISNINRQVIALNSTVGRDKVDVMAERIHDINPEAHVETHKIFYLPENADEIDFSSFSYVIDAVDTITAKLQIIVNAKKLGIPVISCMGAGNKLDPTKFQITDIFHTSICPLARVMRHELRKRNINDLKVLYSTEPPIQVKGEEEETSGKKVIPGSISFVPSVAGLIIASEVVKDICLQP